MCRSHPKGCVGLASFDTQDSPTAEALLPPPLTDEEGEASKVEGLVRGQPARKWLSFELGLPGSEPNLPTICSGDLPAIELGWGVGDSILEVET